MKKVHNRGVSFIELVIAVAIFGIMMCPIISTLIQTMKTSDKAKTAQTKYEFAENLMEKVKSTDSSFYDVKKVKNNTYLTQITDGDINVTSKDSGTVDKNGLQYDYDNYVISGKAKTSKKDGDYYYAVRVSNQIYAEKESNSSYANPNNVLLPSISSFDSSDLAIINGTIGNYDLTVTNAFMSKKLDVLKLGDKTRWEQYTKQQADIVAFPNDKVVRGLFIKVESGKKTVDGEQHDAYTVSCKLKYVEKSRYVLKDGNYKGAYLGNYLDPIEYTPYKQTFLDELPSVYLMYNPCLYNNNYMDYDYIMVDTDTDMNLFIVETTEKITADGLEGLVDGFKQQYKSQHGKDPSTAEIQKFREQYEDVYLINNEAIKERANVNVDIMVNDANSANVKVYHNFEVNKDNKTPIGAVNAGLGTDIEDQDLYDGYTFADTINPMSESTVNSNALYQLEVYISDESLATSNVSDFDKMVQDKGISAIISGSKGGN